MAATFTDMNKVKYEQRFRSIKYLGMWMNQKSSLIGLNIIKYKVVEDETRQAGMECVIKAPCAS